MIIFVLSYGLMWYLVPIVLGSFFSVDVPIANADWAQTMADTQDVLRWLIPLVPTIGIFILVIKVLMTASVRGSD